MRLGRYEVGLDWEEIKNVGMVLFLMMCVFGYAFGGIIIISYIADLSFDSAMVVLGVFTILLMLCSNFLSVEEIDDE